jgi:tetratricopeptide (TPR) repeat protein
MSKTFGGRYVSIRNTILVLAALQLGACSSPQERAQKYYENGLKLFAQHENAKAAIEFRNAVKLKKDLPEAWKLLAEIDEASRNWPGLAADMRALVDIDPKDASARLTLGKLLLLAGSSEEALGLANTGLQLDDRNADLHALKAAISIKQNNHSEATHEAQTALALDPTNADALMVLALDRLGSGDAKGALSLLQDPRVSQAIDRKNNIGFQLLKIKLFGQAGDTKSAEAALRKLIEQNPQEPGYHKLLIDFYVEQKRLDDAENELRNLAAARPSDSESELNLVKFLYTIKKSAPGAQQELKKRIAAGGDAFPYQMALAEINLAEGGLAEGKELLEQLANANSLPEHQRTAKNALAQIYLGQRNFDTAEKLASEVLHDDPHNIAALKVRAFLNLERAQLDAAIADLNDALNSQPRSTDLMLLLAKAYERSGLIELADKEFADATKVSNLDAKIGLEYATFLQRRGSIARAEELLTRLDKRWPNSTSILSALGLVKLARQDWVGAQEVADSIRRIDEGAAGVADQILGAALIGRNKYDEAIAAFQNAYNTAPTAAQPIDSLVEAFLKAKKKDQAVSFLKSVLVKNPNNANALVLLGSIQVSSGEADQALNSFLAAVKARPKDSAGYQALAGFYINQKNYDKAIEVIRTGIIQQQPEITALHMILANALEWKEDYEAAISEYEFILNKQPGNLIAANNMASLLLDRRTDKVSLEKAQLLAAGLRKSQIPQFKDTLSWASYQRGRYRDAVSLSEEAVAALPDQAAVRYHLAMGYIATNQFTKAVEQLNKALELVPNDELAKKIHTELKKIGS